MSETSNAKQDCVKPAQQGEQPMPNCPLVTLGISKREAYSEASQEDLARDTFSPSRDEHEGREILLIADGQLDLFGL